MSVQYHQKYCRQYCHLLYIHVVIMEFSSLIATLAIGTDNIVNLVQLQHTDTGKVL